MFDATHLPPYSTLTLLYIDTSTGEGQGKPDKSILV